jgi:isocitrate dehydrogenase
LALRENNTALIGYSSGLKDALIETVAQGKITGDLKGKTTDPGAEMILDMYGFLDAIESNIDAAVV